jgi:hypothetical protein
MMKLIKTAAAVRSYALYNRGAKPAQYSILSDAGEVLYVCPGSIYGYGPARYSIQIPGGAIIQRGLSLVELRAIAAGEQPLPKVPTFA